MGKKHHWRATMKRLYIVVEGQTEQEFVNSLIAPYLQRFNIYDVTPIMIRTSKTGRGGFVNYLHLKNDVMKLLHSSSKSDFIVTTFVDFFRIPEVPHRERWTSKVSHLEQALEMEKCISDDISDCRFIPYIQLHEFEALLFSSNKGFEAYFTKNEAIETQKIIEFFNNPEDINSSPDGAPSKRLLSIKTEYNKVIEGNLIALEIGINELLAKCPKFNLWINQLIEACRDN